MNFKTKLKHQFDTLTAVISNINRDERDAYKNISKLNSLLYENENLLEHDELILIMELQFKAMNSKGAGISYIEEEILGIFKRELGEYYSEKIQIPDYIYDLYLDFLNKVYDFKKPYDVLGGKRKLLVLDILDSLISLTKRKELLELVDKAFKYRKGKLIGGIMSCLYTMYEENKTELPPAYLSKIKPILKNYDDYSREYKMGKAFVYEMTHNCDWD